MALIFGLIFGFVVASHSKEKLGLRERVGATGEKGKKLDCVRR